jgi:hypothetical protein
VTTSSAQGLDRFGSLEGRLASAYAAEIPADLLAGLDLRIASAIQGRLPWAERRPSMVWRVGRRMLSPVAGVRTRVASWPGRHPRLVRAAPVVLVPALFASLTLTAVGSRSLNGVFAQDGGYTWQHAQRIGLSKTVEGYRVDVLRVYADVNRIVVFASVRDTKNRGAQADLETSLIDSAGIHWDWTEAWFEPAGLMTGSILRFVARETHVTAGARAFTLNVEYVGLLEDGVWQRRPVDMSFPISLDVTPGMLLAPGTAVTQSGVTLTLDDLTVSPSSVRVRLHWSGLPDDEADLTPIVFVTHDGVPLDNPGGGGGGPIGSKTWTEYTGLGAPNPQGHWKVEISQFFTDVCPVNGPTAESTCTRTSVVGPWSFEFDVP